MSLETFAVICDVFSISSDYLLFENDDCTDEVLINILHEAQNNGTTQYKKFVKVIQALASVADRL